MPLVDKIAELKMIRSLQMRINNRTKRYGEMIKGDQAETPELLKSLQDLAERQQRVYRATADLQQKRQRLRFCWHSLRGTMERLDRPA